jgi:chromosome segregation ATPase
VEQMRKIVTEKESGGRPKPGFGTAPFGFKKNEVLEYIKAAEAEMRSSVASYENKLAEQATALSMALREKEKLIAEIDTLSKKVMQLSVNVDEQKSELAAENNVLRTRVANLLEVEKRNEMVTEKLNNLTSKCEYMEAGKKALQDTIAEKEAIILEQLKRFSEVERALKLEIEKIRIETDGRLQAYELKLRLIKENLEKTINLI